MSKRRTAVLTLGGIGVAALLLAGRVEQVRPAMAQTQAQTDAIAFNVTSRERTDGGTQVGEVLIGESIVTRIRSGAGGMTPPQRAVTAANRLTKALEGNPGPESVQVAKMNGDYVVMVNNQLIVTADTYHAAVNKTTPVKLANQWRENLAQAISSRVAAYRAEQERVISKICPIVSVGSGVRLGLANLTGPAAQVHKAAFVGQLETTFQKVVRIRIFVPIKAQDGVDRVPQVNVNAYGDVKM